jgi:ABC-type Fe3+ transport system substrate-binding protein
MTAMKQVVVLLCTLVLVGSVVARAASHLVVIGTQPQTVRDEFAAAFQTWYRAEYGVPVTVEWRDVPGGVSVETYLISRYIKTPLGVGIDVVWGSGIEPYLELASRQLLTPYQVPPASLAKIPAECAGVPLYDWQGRWYGTALSGPGIMFNREVLRRLGLPEPRTWLDLLHPAYYNWLGMLDPRHSATGRTVHEVVLQSLGWEPGYAVLTGIYGNARTLLRSPFDLARAVAAGDLAAGILFNDPGWAHVARFGLEKVGFVLPDGLTYIYPEAAAILKGAPHPDVAQAFVRFLLSETAQKLWVMPVGTAGGPTEHYLGRLPVLLGLYEEPTGTAVVLCNPWLLASTINFNSVLAVARETVLVDFLGATLVDLHKTGVKPAWRAVSAVMPSDPQRGTEQAENALAGRSFGWFGFPPASEVAIMQAAATWTTDQVKRNKAITRWSAAAAASYREAQRLGQ